MNFFRILLTLAVVFNVLNVLDVITTVKGLESGAREINPIVNHVGGVFRLMPFKLLLGLSLFPVIILFRYISAKRKTKFTKKDKIILSTPKCIGISFYAFIVIRNFLVLHQMGVI